MTLNPWHDRQEQAAEHRRALTRLRVARWYAKRGGYGKAHWAPFLGVDGEGGGIDEHGRQNFLLMRAGDDELFTDNQPLATADCLEFLLQQPERAIMVGYFFTYDSTMILRDLPVERVARLFEPKPRGEKGVSPYTYWRDYAIDFRPRQYFRVARLRSRNSTKVIPGSARTVNEVGGFFQKAFVETLKDWEIGDADVLAEIAAGKERRQDFTIMTDIERRYCALEVKMLAELMERFREVCEATNMTPENWRGAGTLAAALHKRYKTPKAKDRKRPINLDVHAAHAYFGGRFEVTAIGRVPGPVYEYDINSAYPAAIVNLPCPAHTRWRRFKAGDDPPAGARYIEHIRFQHPRDQRICGLPIRQKARLFWPLAGEGYYWSPEIEAAYRAGMRITESFGGWYAEKRCECDAFGWVRELYEYRRQIGKAARGQPLKLGINSLYGKFAQRSGSAPWRDLILAGLITASCRAQLVDAAREAPDDILMLATDALFSRRPLSVPVSSELGEWEAQERADIFIVQPGIYWSSNSREKPKTRGIPRSRIIEERDRFEAVWDRWVAGDGAGEVPSVPITVKTFVGHRLALHRNKPLLAGAWLPNAAYPDIKSEKNISFDWSNKRRSDGAAIGGRIETRPHVGLSAWGGPIQSEPFDPKFLSALYEQSLEAEASDDYEPIGNSGE